MDTSTLAARVAHEIAAGRWPEGEALPGVRVLAREVGCSAGTAARAYAALRDAGVLSGSPRSRFVVDSGGAARAARWGTEAVALRLAGSDDPALDVLVRAAGESVCVVPGPRGSVNGMVQLARGTADAAALHLMDAASGRWNDPLARGCSAASPWRSCISGGASRDWLWRPGTLMESTGSVISTDGGSRGARRAPAHAFCSSG